MSNLVIRSKNGEQITIDKNGKVSKNTSDAKTYSKGNIVIRGANGREVSIDRNGKAAGSFGIGSSDESAVDLWNLAKNTDIKRYNDSAPARFEAQMLQNDLINRANVGTGAAKLPGSNRLYDLTGQGLRRRADELAEYARKNPSSGINADAFEEAVKRATKATAQQNKPTEPKRNPEQSGVDLAVSRKKAKNLESRYEAAKNADAYLVENHAFKTSPAYKENQKVLKDALGEYGSVNELQNALKNTQRDVEKYDAEYKQYLYYRDLDKKYSALQSSTDFGTLAVKGSQNLPKYTSLTDIKNMAEEDIAALFINSTDAERTNISRMYEYPGLLENYKYLDDKQKDTYNAIRAKEGEAAGYEYLQTIDPILLRKGYNQKKQELENRVNESALGAIFENVGTVLTAPLRGIDYLGNLAAEITGGGKDALGDTRDYYMTPAKASMVVRGATQEKLNTGVGRFAYNTATSMADNLANLVASGGNEAVSLVLMGTGAASQTYYTAKEKGLTDREALTIGFVAGALEAATEKIGLDNLFDVLAKEGKHFFRSLLSQMGAEGLEEVFSEVGNHVIDRAISGDLSDYNLSIESYMNRGLSPEEAKKMATKDFWTDVALSGASGALSGAGMGAGATAIAYGQAYNQQKNAQGQGILDSMGYDGLMQLARETVDTTEGKAKDKLEKAVDSIKAKKNPRQYIENAPKNAAKLAEKIDKAEGSKYDTMVATLKKSGMSDSSAKAVARQITKDVVNRGEFSEETYSKIFESNKITGTAKSNAIKAAKAEFDRVNNDYAQRIESNAPQQTAKTAVASVTTSVEMPTQTVDIKDVLNGVRGNSAKTNAVMSIYGAARSGVSYDIAISETLNAKDLTAEQQQMAFDAGRGDYFADINGRTETGEIPITKAAKPGVVREYSGKASHTSVRALDAVAKKTGKVVHLVNSIDQINGFDGRTSAKVYKRIGKEGNANAFYNTKTGEYYVALDALDKSYLLVAMHESVHDGAQNNKDGFDKLAKITKEVLVKNGYDQAELDNVEDLEEFMCNTVPVILTDRATIDEFVSRIIGADVSTRNAFQRFLDRVYNSILEAYNALKNDPQWGQMEKLRNDLEGIKRMREAYFEMLEGTTKAKTENGITIDPASGAAVFSLKTAPKTDAEIEAAIQRLVDSGFDRASAESWLQSLTSVGGVILQNLESLDYEADERFTWLKKNSDYSQGSVDFNNNCPKRVEFTALFDRLQKEFPNVVFTAEDYETIRQILIRNKIAVTCGPCFVEDRRQHLGEIAQQFIDQLNSGELAPKFTAMVGKDTYVPTQYDLVTYGGAQALYKEHRGVYNAFIAFNNARGMASARLVEGMAEYNNQIKKWSKRTITSKNNKGGLRIFSLSDADPRIMIDVIQIVIDAAEKGLMIQGYTKKPWFAKMIKDTGIKMLRSHIPLGSGVQLVNGKKMLMFDNVEGINTKDPDYFDSTDYRNIGNNVIGINDPQIRAAMVTDMIDQIIPFHTGLKAEIRNKKKIGNWMNYRNEQTDKVSATGKKADKQINIYTDVLNAYANAGNPIKNKREFVQAFLDVCKERGLTPRFSRFLNTNANGDFVYTEGYHKFLVDYKLFDKNGDIILQQPVQPIFDDAYNKKILNDYVKDSGVKVNRGDVYQEIKEEVIEQPTKKFSLKYFAKDGRRFVDIDQNQDKFDGHDVSEYPRIAKNIINDKFVGKVVGIDNKMFVNGKGRDEYAHSSKMITGDLYEAKMRASGEIDNLLDAGTNFRNEPDGRDGHFHPNAVGGFDYFDTIFKIFNKYFEGVVNIENTKRGKLFKDVTKLKDVTEDIANSYGKDPAFGFLRTSSMPSVSQPETESQGSFSLKTKDSSYLAAVNRGDMETAQKMVDQAAREAGYETEHLYHGTSFFGFTKTDVSQSDDNMSFFATNNPEVAQGYMPWYEDEESDLYHEEARRIGKPQKDGLKSLRLNDSVETVLRSAKNLFGGEYKNARIATDKETLDRFKGYEIPEAVDAAVRLKSKDVPEKIKTLCDLVIETNDVDTFAEWAKLSKRYDEFDNAYIPYNPDDYSADILWSRVVMGLQSISKMAKTTPIWNDGNIISKSQIVDRYNTLLGGKGIGMYDLYAKADRQLVVTGFGSNWNNIPLGKIAHEFNDWWVNVKGHEANESGLYTRGNTRSIAEYAKYAGYRSVLFTDIYDSGSYGNRGDMGDVYAFFYPEEDVKSADPVTYDDAGNVIPLSDRFNAKNNDIRYSAKTPKNFRTDAEILKTAKGTTEAEKNALSLYNLNRESLAQRTSNLLMLQEQIETAKGKDKSALAAQIRRMENDVQEFEARMNKLREKQELQDILIRERVSEWGDFLSEFGMLPKGEQAAGTEENREIDVPAALNKTSKVSRYARTILESRTIPDEMIDPIRAKILEGGMSYIPESNANVMAAAMARTEEKNISNAWEIWDAAVRGEIKKIDSSITALGEALLKRTAESGDAKQTVILAAELTEMFSRAGKVLQSAKLLKRMGVAGQIAYLDRTVASINRSIAKRGAKIASKYHVTINEELMNKLVSAKTDAERDAVMGEIYKDIADQMPNTFVDKWNAWRYLAMLGNPLTHIRNIVGNAMFVPAITAKNVIATGIEKSMISMGAKFTPTKALIVDKQYSQFAKNDFEEIKNELVGGSKYNDEDQIRAKQKVFGFKPLEAVRNFNFNLLEMEDGLFLKMHYRNALGQYLKANKIDLTMMSQETLGKARAYAIMEAQKATYRDASSLANALQTAGNNSSILKFALDSVVPFKKTPINVLKRGVEYSPIGLVTTMAKGLNSVIKKGKTGSGTMTMAEFIDGMAAGTVGTGVVALGYFLASLGMLVGGLGDDDEDRLRKLTGEQGYAIKIGDNTYTISWAAPVALPFLVGAALYDTVNEKQEWDASSVFEALSLVTEPMVTLSMLDGIQSMLESAAMAKKEERLSKLSEAAISSYVSQPFPTALAQIARIIDPNQRSMYIDKTNKIPDGIERIGQSIMKKIPGLTKLIMASRNEWGEERTSGIGERLVENLVSPGYYSKVEYNAVETELARLLDATGDGAIVPDTPSKKINDMDLTRDEYEAYVALIGQPSLKLLSELIKTDEYKAMADDEKAAAIKYAHTYVKELAKYGIKPEIGEPADWIMQLSNSSGDVAATAQGILDHTQEQYIGTKQKDAFWSAIDANDMDSAKAYIEEQRAAGKEDSSIWQSVQSKYKEAYIDLVKAGDTKAANELTSKLQKLGLKSKNGEAYASADTFKKWKFDAENDFAWDDRYDAYRNGDISASELKTALMKTGGLTADEASNKIAQIDFEMDHPELDGKITYTQYKRWEADGKPEGVSLELFTTVAGFRDNGTSEKAKSQDEVAEYIDSMPISNTQKDALWCCFYKETTLKKAPWN